MKNFFVYRQNNSGGVFGPPAVYVIVEADSLQEANERVSTQITLCGDSGLYADYDDCGCCPCCGHRWMEPYSGEPRKLQVILKYDLCRTYFGTVGTALIKADNTMTTSDTDQGYADIESYLRQADSPL